MKPKVTAAIIPKKMESVTVLPPGMTFETYFTTLFYQKKLELTKYLFGERVEVKMISELLPNGFTSEFKFENNKQVFDSHDIEWAIHYIINRFNSFNAKIKPGKTTWNELKKSLMRQYHDKVKTRELYDVTGPVFWPGYNFVGPGKELATCKNCRLHSSLICGCSCSIVRLCI
jgi:hypothetical protein